MSKELFNELRSLAAQTRDRKIAEIRAEYSKTISDIAEMEQRLIGKPVAKRPKSVADEKLIDLIASLIPNDRAVTVDDVQGMITAVDPTRSPNIQTVRATLHRLVKEGTIKKLSNPQHGAKVKYALPDYAAGAIRPMADWAEQILRERGEPMKSVEIMVAMTEAGYEMQCPPGESVKNLENALKQGRLFSFDKKMSKYACHGV